MNAHAGDAKLTVVAPSLALTISIESAPTGGDEVHVHAGGQGFWVARMARTLDARVRLCSVLGGETGEVVATLVRAAEIELEAVDRDHTTGAIVDDNRGEESTRIAATEPVPLGRHEVDELFGLGVAAGIDADMTMITGTSVPDYMPADFYRRLASDLRANGAAVGADLSGAALAVALDGGLDFVKVADDELRAAGFAKDDDEESITSGLRALVEAGAENALVTRGTEPALALVDGEALRIEFPRLEPVEPRGSGDSIFAAVCALRATGSSWHDALRAGIAAGTLNVTRRGLGSGRREDINALTEFVTLSAIP